MPKFSVTVLGASPAWPNPGGACSGYLVRNEAEAILLDCGFGVVSRLREQLPLDELTAIMISHLHADHFMDLVPLRYGLKYGDLRADPRLPLYAPPGATEFFARLGNALDGDEHFFDGTYQLTEYAPGETLRVGSLQLEFKKVKHYIPAYAMAVTAERKLVFSGDAAPCDPLVDIARQADLFLCEAAITSPVEDDPVHDRRGHMTATEAAQLAQAAGVRRLLLTHFRRNSVTRAELLSQISANFCGLAELAEERRTYDV